MKKTGTVIGLSEQVRQFVRRDFSPRFGELTEKFATSPVWGRLRELGSELWLDTGDVEAAGDHWTREFTALTTNNTLLNREVQKGMYDELIPSAAAVLGVGRGVESEVDSRLRREIEGMQDHELGVAIR